MAEVDVLCMYMMTDTATISRIIILIVTDHSIIPPTTMGMHHSIPPTTMGMGDIMEDIDIATDVDKKQSA